MQIETKKSPNWNLSLFGAGALIGSEKEAA
jgi:hypothetical protein